MKKIDSLSKRIAIGKLVGLFIGVVGFIALPWFAPNLQPMVRWGFLLWYSTIGAFIGIFGIYRHHPVLNLPLPWWLRSSVVGAWMNFLLVLFAYEKMLEITIAFFGPDSIFLSPFWFCAEGALVGVLIGGILTWLFGEGRSLVNA